MKSNLRDSVNRPTSVVGGEANPLTHYREYKIKKTLSNPQRPKGPKSNYNHFPKITSLG